MKEKSIEESEIKSCSLFTIKHGYCGSKSTPLETQVPFNKGFTNDFTYKGISFFCKGCNVFG
ncbi:hypothetical protein D3C71_2033050 [compost metagenome]